MSSAAEGSSLLVPGELLPTEAPVALWPFQQRAIEQLDAAVAAGSRAPLLVLPTGAGKTVIAAYLMSRAVERHQRALFLAPRRELVGQTSAKLAGQRHGVLLAGAEAQRDLYALIQVASIETLQSRLVRRKRLVLPDFDLVLVDEAHLSVTAARKALLALWPNALRIGLTATPTRKDGRALGLLYDSLIEPTTTAELTRQRYLAPARYFSLGKPDLERVRTLAGDFHQGELEAAMNQPRLVADVVETWFAHAPPRRTAVFASSIAHSVSLCEGYLRAGVAAEHVDADTPQQMRDATFARFRDGRTQVLTNCFLASYGFDLPDLACVVLARPTKSLQLYLQMVGRGLRTTEGKTNCLVLDHSGCVHQHGFAHDLRVWTLDGDRALVESHRFERERREAKVLECPECHCTFSGARLCPECGYFFAPRGREIKTLEGELVEIGEHLEPEEQERAVLYAELRGVAAERGFKVGWAAHQYLEKFKDWPPRAWNNHPAATPSLQTRRWIQSRFIAWRKARERTAPA